MAAQPEEAHTILTAANEIGHHTKYLLMTAYINDRILMAAHNIDGPTRFDDRTHSAHKIDGRI
jgi:hypothetical protein